MKRALLALLLPLLAAPAAQAQEAARRWNVVVITADTLRGDKLGVNGHPQIKTPHLDALAAEGVNFSRAYTNITTTTPSHASLFSSLYPQDHRAYGNTSSISAEIDTLPEILGRAGWHTAGIVNMPWLNPDVTGVSQGIQELARGDHVRKAPATNKWALSFLQRQKGAKKPFFLWVHYVDNHTPYHAPGKYDTLYYPKGRVARGKKPGTLQEIWPLFPNDHRDNAYVKRWLKGITDADYVVANYDGSVSYIDAKVGELIAALKANGQWEDTLFVFTSDHGEALGEHGLWFCHGGLFEATTRIPLIVRVPGGSKGREVKAVVDLVDVTPTLLTLLGLPRSEVMRGDDLGPLMRGAAGKDSAAYLEHTGRQLEGVVTERWKLIRHRKTRRIYPSYPMNKGTIELYDLIADPGEAKNVAAQHPEVVRELMALMKRLKSGARGFKDGAAKIDAETEEALRALGYME